MMNLKKYLRGLVVAAGILSLVSVSANAQKCSDKLFSVTIDNSLSIGDAVENLAETCDLTLIVKDSGARHRLDKKLYYVKLKNASIRSFLDTILSENDLNYELKGNRLSISYLVTRTFKVHYISGKRSGKSSAHVTIANSSASAGASGGSKTGISIENDDEFKFWSTVKGELHRILVSAGDGGTHYTKVENAWIGPDGQKWEYNPLEPIINPEAGMVTVTGTAKQIRRVSKYLSALTKQIKAQVLIDVKILTVAFDNSRTTGVDWGQLYGLQNFTIDALSLTEKNINKLEHDKDGFKKYEWAEGRKKNSASALQVKAHASVTEVIKFLKTQGDVKSVSSPRIMTLNNQPALISVGKELFYKLKTATKKDGDSTEGEMIDSVFAGILLDITPEIDERGMVTLKINPSITETLTPVSGDGTRTMPPDLVRRQIASVIKVKEGNHAILGGLISTTTGTKTNKVPLLGDIPLLEYAFKREEKIEKTEELVIIITPHIIKNNRNLSLKDLGYKRLR
ncbi:MAG: pilus (MSHA type) biogenesis protein MshL [Sulfurovum sp.]|nr:pilus (MSHA type) biogenesis protein MshL [Sulfurovum sp.]